MGVHIPKQAKAERPLVPITIILLLIILSLIEGLIRRIFGPAVAITVASLVVVWGVDISLKVVLKFGTTTAPADLSLSAFVFSIGRAVDSIGLRQLASNDANIFLDFFSLGVGTLLCLWLANIFLCHRYDQRFKNSGYPTNFERVICYGLGIFSAFILVTQVGGFDFINWTLDFIISYW